VSLKGLSGHVRIRRPSTSSSIAFVAGNTDAKEEQMSTLTEVERADEELALLNADPTRYARDMGLPIELSDLTDVDMVTDYDIKAIIVICTVIPA
jgi:hypothetical protein